MIGRLLFCCLSLIAGSGIWLEGVVTPVLHSTPIHEAFIPKVLDGVASMIISQQPPEPLELPIPPQPETDLVWIPGYWALGIGSNDFQWVCGVWRRPPPGQHWIAGQWEPYQGGWVWLRGFWSVLPLNQLPVFEQAPPAAVYDKMTKTPHQNLFWVPGYWEYSQKTKQYIWLSGTWIPFRKDWVLVPAGYVWSPEGYRFSSMYWDYPLEARGSAYDCTEPGSPVVIAPDVMIRQLFACFPDYMSLYWHWWHMHPGWWDGCWCMPPWWGWQDWWALPSRDMWALWLWWSRPGSLPPRWLSSELASKIMPPSDRLVAFMKKAPMPEFLYIPGNEFLVPQGTDVPDEMAPPPIPNNVTPGGRVIPPILPKYTRSHGY